MAVAWKLCLTWPLSHPHWEYIQLLCQVHDQNLRLVNVLPSSVHSTSMLWVLFTSAIAEHGHSQSSPPAHIKGTPFDGGRETTPPPCRLQWPSVLTEMSGQERHQVRTPKAPRALTWSSTIFKHACSSEHFTSDQLLEHWNSCLHWFLPKLIVDLGRKNFPVSSFGHSCKFYPALSFK